MLQVLRIDFPVVLTPISFNYRSALAYIGTVPIRERVPVEWCRNFLVCPDVVGLQGHMRRSDYSGINELAFSCCSISCSKLGSQSTQFTMLIVSNELIPILGYESAFTVSLSFEPLSLVGSPALVILIVEVVLALAVLLVILPFSLVNRPICV